MGCPANRLHLGLGSGHHNGEREAQDHGVWGSPCPCIDDLFQDCQNFGYVTAYGIVFVNYITCLDSPSVSSVHQAVPLRLQPHSEDPFCILNL